MRNLRLEIEYDGTNYCGWQVQNNSRKKSIQGTIEKSLRKILREKIRLIVSGRTDAGVHALAQVANFRTHSEIASGQLQRALNGNLPADIRIRKIKEVDPDFHSRFQAKSKTYRYSILNQPYSPVFLRHTAYLYSYPLDIGLMRKEARILLGRHDFRSFQAADKKERSSVRSIKSIRVGKKGQLIYFDMEADGFLYNMVRNIAGTLIEIGRGRFPSGYMKKVLSQKDRRLAGQTAPAKGLCLIKVKF
ncbi:MAG: tRNA pseudouridine(38-40) synthase TruA [Candidatus Omnitrophota bacterium]